MPLMQFASICKTVKSLKLNHNGGNTAMKVVPPRYRPLFQFSARKVFFVDKGVGLPDGVRDTLHSVRVCS